MFSLHHRRSPDTSGAQAHQHQESYGQSGVSEQPQPCRRNCITSS